MDVREQAIDVIFSHDLGRSGIVAAMFIDLDRLTNKPQCGCQLALELHRIISGYSYEISADGNARFLWHTRILRLLRDVITDSGVLTAAEQIHLQMLALLEKYDWNINLSLQEFGEIHASNEIIDGNNSVEAWLDEKGVSGLYILDERDDSWMDELLSRIAPPKTPWISIQN